MKDNFHVDMSGRIYKNKTVGIAILGTKTKENYGCALKGIGSLADNYANIYRRRALKPTKRFIGRRINIVEVNYKIIKRYWEEIK